MHKTASILDQYPHYEMNIGIEIHVQLTTKSKIFCSNANGPAQDANKNICPVCAGHPGILPQLNKKVVDCAILAGLATNCSITRECTFARKHYFYPDLPKGYQTTQSTQPICSEGYIPIRLENGDIKNIRLIRIHMEEDAGKNIHASGTNESFVDLNRAGTPLLEIVSYPDIASTYEARTYLKAVHAIVKCLNICSGNMEEGAFRADTNISVRKKGATQLGTRCELKNINSFKFISDAIEYEIQRQIELLESGKTIRQETRLWDTKSKESVVMRGKEEAADYLYFTEPDLPIIRIDDAWLARIKETLPELPDATFKRLMQAGLSDYEADILVDDLDLVRYFDEAVRYTKSKQLINWILRDVMGYLKEHKIDLSAFKVTAQKLARIVDLVEQGTINNNAAKLIFAEIAQTGAEPDALVQEKGLAQIGSSDELEAIVKEIIAANPEQVAQYRSGKDKLFGFFVGQAMQKTKGNANPKMLQDLIKKHLQP